MTAPSVESLGLWSAYVAAGATREERAARLAAAPERLRSGVEAHVRTVYAIKNYHQRRAHEAKR
jgi:hypothetical protein